MPEKYPMKKRISRRKFLSRGPQRLAAGGLILGSCINRMTASAQQSILGTNTRITLGLIGCGRRGGQLLEQTLHATDAVFGMVCDVDAKRAAQAADRAEQIRGRRPTEVGDYRRLLDDPNIDGVIIATPDHWHASQHALACLAGKDVYVETPISHNVSEGLFMRRATRKYRRVVQVGLQQRSAEWVRDALKPAHEGELGNIAKTRTWTFAKARAIVKTPDQPPPEWLDYDRWLGPAPIRGYNPNVVGYFANWWDYGGGTICQRNPHLHDVIHWGMQINAPKSVVAVGNNSGLNDFRETPDTLEVIYEYETPNGPFVHVYSQRLHNGHAAWGPPIPGHNGKLEPGVTRHYGTEFFGSQATLFIDQDGAALFPTASEQPQTLTKSPQSPAGEKVDRLTRAHLADFVNCMRTRAEPRAPIEVGYFAALPSQLANIAYRVGRKLYYDPKTQKLAIDPEFKQLDKQAGQLLVREYRDPYTLPAI